MRKKFLQLCLSPGKPLMEHKLANIEEPGDRIERDGKLWRAVVKTTRDREELFLTTLHRARANDLRRAERKFDNIEREEG